MSTALKRARLAKMSSEVRDLVLGQRLHLGALRPPASTPVVDVGLDLRPGHAHQRPVAHARRDGLSIAPPVRLVGVPAAGAGRDSSRPLRRRLEATGRAPRLSAADTSAKLAAARAKGAATAAAEPATGAGRRPQRGEAPRGTGPRTRALGQTLVVGGLRLPAKGATHICPSECCAGVKRRERARSAGLPRRLQGRRGPGVGSGSAP